LRRCVFALRFGIFAFYTILDLELLGLTVQSVLLVFQLRAIDKQRITRKIGHLENDLIEKVNQEMKDLLGLG
jgi:mRNA interferase MazF